MESATSPSGGMFLLTLDNQLVFQSPLLENGDCSMLDAMVVVLRLSCRSAGVYLGRAP